MRTGQTGRLVFQTHAVLERPDCGLQFVCGGKNGNTASEAHCGFSRLDVQN